MVGCHGCRASSRIAPRSTDPASTSPPASAGCCGSTGPGAAYRCARWPWSCAPSGCATSASALSRHRGGGFGAGAVVDGYEQVLGLAPGRLRAAVDVLCRTFDHGPPDRGARPGAVHAGRVLGRGRGRAGSGAERRGLAAVRARARRRARVRSDGRPDGAAGGPAGRRDGPVVGVAYTSRYEALGRLRCGPYAAVVGDVIREAVRAPDTGCSST